MFCVFCLLGFFGPQILVSSLFCTGCEGFIRHRPPGPHPRIRLALSSEIEKIHSLARRSEKINIPPRTKEPFSLEIYILGLKFSLSLENVNPGPCFSVAREGPGMKKPFSIENFIPY